MRRMPERPLLAEAQDKKETIAFFTTLVVAAFFTLTVVGLAYRGDTVFTRVLQAACVFGSAFLANLVRQKMANEHNEKVRVWLDYWDEYKEDMESLKKKMLSEPDEYVRETLKMELDKKKRFYEDNY